MTTPSFAAQGVSTKQAIGSTLGEAPLLEIAEALAEEVWQQRVSTKDGGITWIRPGAEARGESPATRQRVDPFLYDGTAGIALFLAAWALVSTRSEWRERCLLAIAPVRRKMAQLVADPERARNLQRIPVGGIIGIGSLVYSFTRVGTMLGEVELIGEACDLLTLLTPERLAANSTPDVLYGSAGLILALSALHHEMAKIRRDSGPLLEVTSLCGRRLLEDRSWCHKKPKPSLPQGENLPCAGFSHGAGGISYALLRLHAATGEQELQRAALAGFDFERSLYSAEHENWRDVREPCTLRFESGWCRGCAGIALARLAALRLLDSRELRDELAIALESTRRAGLAKVDHLCCGNMGRVEVLNQAHLQLDEAPLDFYATQLAFQIWDRSKQAGSFQWRRDMASDPFDPTFFTGASGVGYALLRLTSPETLPCVLLLD